MKKVLIYSLTLALLFSLAACGKPQAEQPTEPDPTASASTSADISTPEPVTTPESPAPEQLANKTPAAPAENEASQPPEDTTPSEPPAEEEVKLFDEVNEEVWATGTVNIRESWTADSTKLGSLNAGQSVTRTGTGLSGTEAEGWSRVKLSDGSEVYVASSYLTTTKPTTQSNPQPNGGSQQQTSPTQPQGDNPYGSGGLNIQNPTAGMTPEEIEAAAEAARQETEQDIAATQGTMY